MKTTASILVATDLMGASDAVPRGAASLAAPTRASVHMLHVIPRVFDTEDFPFDRAVIGPELHRERTSQRCGRRGRRDFLRREGGGAAPW